RREEHRPDDREDRGRGAHAGRGGQDRPGGEARRAFQTPQREPDAGDEVFHGVAPPPRRTDPGPPPGLTRGGGEGSPRSDRPPPPSSNSSRRRSGRSRSRGGPG